MALVIHLVFAIHNTLRTKISYFVAVTYKMHLPVDNEVVWVCMERVLYLVLTNIVHCNNWCKD